MVQNKKELENRQFNEMKQLEENFNAEIKAVNDYWNNEFQNLKNHYDELTNQMEHKHKKEMQNLKDYVEDKFNKNFKFSTEYLDLKTSESNLVRQERYVEAHKIKQRCDYLEKAEIERHLKLKEDNINLKSENLAKQQNLEKSALEQKITSEFDEMSKIKQVEIEKIITKYKNKRFELETKQGKEKNLHENENLLKATIFNSNLININLNTLENVNRPSSNKNSANKLNSFSEAKLREIAPYSKRSEKNNSISNLSENKKNSKVNIPNNNNNFESSNNQMLYTNKSQKMFNNNSINSINSKKPAYVRNLQYSTAKNN